MDRKPAQLNLFGPPPNYDVGAAIAAAMNEAAARSGLSRDQILDKMNDLADRSGVKLVGGAGKRVSLDTLDKWLNPAETGRNIPLKALPIFCAAVADATPLAVLAAPLRVKVITEEEARLLAWARESVAARKAARRKKQLEKDLGI